MAPLTLHSTLIPTLHRGLTVLSSILAKGAAHAAAANTPASDLIDARLAPDMGNLAFQVQRASDNAKLACVRLAGAENVSMPDTEASFAELEARVRATLAVVDGVKEADFTGAEVVVRSSAGELKFTSEAYVSEWVLPNFYFHVTTAYALLRMKGVPLGKADYLGHR